MLRRGWVGGTERVVRWPVWLHVSACLNSGDAGLGWEPDRAKKTCANAEPLLCIACASSVDARSAQPLLYRIVRLHLSLARCVCSETPGAAGAQPPALVYIQAERLGAEPGYTCHASASFHKNPSAPARCQRASQYRARGGRGGGVWSLPTLTHCAGVPNPSRRDTRRACRPPPHAQRGPTHHTTPGSLRGGSAGLRVGRHQLPQGSSTYSLEWRCRERWQGG